MLKFRSVSYSYCDRDRRKDKMKEEKDPEKKMNRIITNTVVYIVCRRMHTYYCYCIYCMHISTVFIKDICTKS